MVRPKLISMHTFITVSKLNRDLVKKFLSGAGTSLLKFRYFNKRPIDVLDDHLLTLVMCDEKENVVAYGHLDKEGEEVWLGIAVAENEKRKGLGRMMMKELIAGARELRLDRIQLAVDLDNEAAISMYKKNGFREMKRNETNTIYQLKL